MFFRYAYNKRTETRFTNGITSGPAQDGQLPLERTNKSGVADWVRTMSSSLVLNVRVGLNQYLELARSDPGLGFDSAELGFRLGLVGQLPNQVFPRINLYRHHRRRLRHDRISGPRPPEPQQRDDHGLQPAAELLVADGQSHDPRRSRHAPHVVHARDQRQPVPPRLRSPLHAARVRHRRRAQRQLARVVPARRGRAAAASTTTSTRRSAGTTTRRGSRTTGRSAIA